MEYEQKRRRCSIARNPSHGARLDWVTAILCFVILGILAVPWPSPDPEVSIEKFVPDFITVNLRGFLPNSGQIRVSAREVVISTTPRSQPTLHLLTAEVPFTAEFSVSILRSRGDSEFPFQVRVWDPLVGVAVEAWYAPDGTIMAGIRENDTWLQTRRLGEYRVGDVRRWRVQRTGNGITFEALGRGQRAIFEVAREEFPRLVEQPVLSVTLLATAPGASSSTVVVRDPIISVPRQTSYGTETNSRWFRLMVLLVAFLSLSWTARWAHLRLLRLEIPTRDLLIMLSLGGASLLVGWWLSKFPGHPLDMRAVEVWSRIARDYGPAAVPGYSLLATSGNVYGGTPYAPITYPYPPLLTYLFWIVGKVASRGHVEQTFKILAVMGVAVGGCVLYGLLRRINVTRPIATVAASAYALNPAILFDAAVWGQTDSFVGLFLLVGAAGTILSSAPLLWIGSILALLTKQTGGLAAPILLVFGIVRLGVRPMIRGLPPAILLSFLVLTPTFLSGAHPSAIYRPVISKLLALGATSGREPANAVVSQGAFTLWTALVGVEGARGLERMAFPDSAASPFGVTYFDLSRLTFILFTLLMAFMIYRRKEGSPGAPLVATAAYALGAVFLLTRVLPRYFFFGVMFTAASLPWLSGWRGATALVALSMTMLVSMWGSLVFVSAWYPGLLPVFEPERSWLNGAMMTALGGNIGITLGALANAAALFALLTGFFKCGRERAGSAPKAPVGDQ